jgi:hypothetical protein
VVASLILIKNIISTILEKRKRDVTKDEQDFLNWMRKIPSLRGELEIVNHPNRGQIRRWHIKIGNETNRIYIEDDKYNNYIIIYPSGKILGCDSGPIDEDHESLGMRFIIYDFRSTKELSKFKQIHTEIVRKMRSLQLKEDEIRKRLQEDNYAKKGSDIIWKMRTG